MKKPKTEREWALYRAKLSCRVGRGNVQKGRMDAAMFALLHAVEDVAAALSHDCKPIVEKTVLQFRK